MFQIGLQIFQCLGSTEYLNQEINSLHFIDWFENYLLNYKACSHIQMFISYCLFRGLAISVFIYF